MTWGWRKLLANRSLIRPYIWKTIGNGAETNAWSDTWSNVGPLRAFITPRLIANAGFSLQSSLAELVSQDGQWIWPTAWFDLFPVLINLVVPNLSDNSRDRLVWKDLEGNNRPFSSWEVWNNVRHHASKVQWGNLVWFKQCIPRHAFHVWLVIQNKLKTQDRLSVWEAGSETNLNLMCCPLCCNNRDSRDHLFFECSFAMQVWNNVRCLTNMEDVNGSWTDVMAWMTHNSSLQKPDNVVSRLVVAAASYFIWQERNSRLFSRNHRTAMVVSQEIIYTVRMRLISLKFKRSFDNGSLVEKWKIPGNNLEIDPG
ncbi:uncharacterized protein LOC110900579 [Helianthus annuus]|uniref:uncharacterized protein LOC110900579 n=1 Tax=Helianthus annuus TaxID=4232 RepID=UPI000B907EBE|nr:uncharacterized protein LOC110900579 [Helianthus annuus]